MPTKQLKPKILVSGSASGIGRYLCEKLGCAGFDRGHFPKSGAVVIIHCAFNSQATVTADMLYSYLEDNVFLTKKLADAPHKKFIFFSTIDIYPQDGAVHTEKEVIDTGKVHGVYALTKLMSESIIKETCSNYLILRPATLLGPYMRKNTLLKIIEEKKPCVGLSADSNFNYIHYADVASFIKFAIEKDLKGIYNIAASSTIRLSQACCLLKKHVRFGDHKYDAGRISNKKISAVFPAFKKETSEVLSQFLNERLNA